MLSLILQPVADGDGPDFAPASTIPTANHNLNVTRA